MGGREREGEREREQDRERTNSRQRAILEDQIKVKAGSHDHSKEATPFLWFATSSEVVYRHDDDDDDE